MASTEAGARSVSWAGPMVTLLGGADAVFIVEVPALARPLLGFRSAGVPAIWVSCPVAIV